MIITGTEANSQGDSLWLINIVSTDINSQQTFTTKVVSLKPAHGEMYSIQHYVIMFVGDLQQVGGFLHQ